MASRVSTRVYQSTQNPRDLEQNVGLFKGQGRYSAQPATTQVHSMLFDVFSVVKFLDLKHRSQHELFYSTTSSNDLVNVYGGMQIYTDPQKHSIKISGHT